MVICLQRGADLHMAQLMPLPLIVSFCSKIQIGFTFLVPAHPGSPGKRAVKWVCVAYVCNGCRRIFWIDAGGTGPASIQSSKMTGADRKTVLGSGNIARPVGLCTDVDGQRLYWSDHDFGTISTSDYDGNGIRYFRLPQSYARLLISLTVNKVSAYDEALRAANDKII